MVSADNAILTADCEGGAVVSVPFDLSATLDYELDSAPTWNAEFAGISSYNENLVGDDTWTSTLDSTGTTSLIATASRTTGGGLAEGDGYVQFLKNGIVLDTQTFSAGEDVSDINYTFLGLTGGESFEIIISEIREDFIISAELTPFISTISYRVQYVGYPNMTLTGSSSVTKTRTSPSSLFDIDTNVFKLTNGGIAEDAGTILWKRNGVTENTENFILGDTVSYTYEFVGVQPGDELLVEIFEG